MLLLILFVTLAVGDVNEKDIFTSEKHFNCHFVQLLLFLNKRERNMYILSFLTLTTITFTQSLLLYRLIGAPDIRLLSANIDNIAQLQIKVCSKKV